MLENNIATVIKSARSEAGQPEQVRLSRKNSLTVLSKKSNQVQLPPLPPLNCIKSSQGPPLSRRSTNAPKEQIVVNLSGGGDPQPPQAVEQQLAEDLNLDKVSHSNFNTFN